MEWSKKFELGIQSVDSQHQNIIERIGRLEIALDSQATSVTYPRLKEAHEFLESYVSSHFREEEELMEKGGYPDLAAHKLMHAKFEEDLAKFRDNLGHRGLITHATATLIKYLSKWFIDHIKNEDPKYVPYVK
ncbi:MAG: hemerythrin family protein [Magnetococcales bacterium]|nr:hemerythrin family protein [Magnetococcales bacterium]